MTSKEQQQVSTQIQKWVSLYHITAQMFYNPMGRDNSKSLLESGILPHVGRGPNGQESGFFVWTSAKHAMLHARYYATGERSLITVKVPLDSVRFPDWKFDAEGFYANPFLLDGLCAKHARAVRQILRRAEFQKEMTLLLCSGSVVLHKEKNPVSFIFYDMKGNIINVVESNSAIGRQIIEDMQQHSSAFRMSLETYATKYLETTKREEAFEQVRNFLGIDRVSYAMDSEQFQRYAFSLLKKRIKALASNTPFMESLRQKDMKNAKQIALMQICCNPTRWVVRHKVDGKVQSFCMKDRVYERILNALLQRCPEMRADYNELLQRRACNQSISFMVDGIPYSESSERAFPLKYTGNETFPIFSATKLTTIPDEKNKIRAADKPRFSRAVEGR